MLHAHSYFILAGTGLLGGFVDAIAGGSGLLTLPMLLSLGVPAHVAIGTNKLGSVIGMMSSVTVYIRKRLYNPKNWWRVILMTFVAGLIGATTVHFINVDWLGKFIPIVIILVAIYFAIPKSTNIVPREYDYQPSIKKAIPLATILGLYDGALGAGTGSFWATALMIVFRLDLLQASAVARLLNYASTVASFIVFAYYGSIDYLAGIIMGLGLITGAYFGAHSAIRFGKDFIKPIFLVVVLGIAVKLIIHYWF
jgi:uncharacterized membrane protein YfcA